MLNKSLSCLILVASIALLEAADKGTKVGCFKRSSHEDTQSINLAKNCLDYCANGFYR